MCAVATVISKKELNNKQKEKKEEDKQEFKLPPSDETSLYTFTPSQLYSGIKNNNENLRYFTKKNII